MALDKVIDSAELDANLTAVADAIRTKGGTTGELEFPNGFVSAVEGIQAGGGGFSVDDFLTHAFPSGNIVATRATKIYRDTFRDNTTITSFESNTVTDVQEYAFAECTALENIKVPNAVAVGSNAFLNCNISSIELPNVTTISSAFQGTKIKSIILPKATSCGFAKMSYLETVTLPALITPSANMFQYDSKLRLVDFGKCSTLVAKTFNGTSASGFKTLILRKSDAICTLANVSAFSGTPFASNGTGGTVYVPSALITQYQQATNWSTLYTAGTCNFVAIEGSEYE